MKVGAFFIHINHRRYISCKTNASLLYFHLFSFPLWLLQQEEDTTKIYHANEVVVTATRTAIAPEDAPAQVRLVSQEDIQRVNGTTVADILQTVDGVTIMDYGATGGVKTITTRGLTSANVTILLDGNPLNDQQNGIVDLSLLPLSSIERIEFVSGGASALYGGNATGGVVNLITRRASQDFHALAKGSLGSFGERDGVFELGGRFASIGIVAGVSQESGNDNFPFLYHRIIAPDTTLIRTNVDYARTLVYWNGDYRPSNDMSINSFVQYTKLEHGNPGSIDLPLNQRQSDETFHGIVDASISVWENIIWKIDGIYDQANELVHDTLRYTYFNKSTAFHSQIEWLPAKWDRILGGVEYSDARLATHDYSILYDSHWNVQAVIPNFISPVRIQKSTYVSNEITIKNGAEWFDRFIFTQSGRYDGYSDVRENAFSPKLGMNIRVNKVYNVHLRSSWGQDFRVPTFNDLYYPGYSNPNLNPERSTAFDVGVIGSIDQIGRQTLEITYFNIASKDKIVLNPMFIPYNIGKAENTGLEIRYDYHSADNRFDAYTGFSFVDARKKDRIFETDSTYNKYLQYVPLASGVFELSFQTDIGRISINETYTGLRYIDATNINSLPAYALTDVNLIENISLSHYQLTINVSIKNIFDTDYQSYADYPMPGRSFKISLGIEY